MTAVLARSTAWSPLTGYPSRGYEFGSADGEKALEP